MPSFGILIRHRVAARTLCFLFSGTICFPQSALVKAERNGHPVGLEGSRLLHLDHEGTRHSPQSVPCSFIMCHCCAVVFSTTFRHLTVSYKDERVNPCVLRMRPLCDHVPHCVPTPRLASPRRRPPRAVHGSWAVPPARSTPPRPQRCFFPCATPSRSSCRAYRRRDAPDTVGTDEKHLGTERQLCCIDGWCGCKLWTNG